jgi:hypothetical protein
VGKDLAFETLEQRKVPKMTITDGEDFHRTCGWNVILGYRDNPYAALASLGCGIAMVGEVLVEIRDILSRTEDQENGV